MQINATPANTAELVNFYTGENGRVMTRYGRFKLAHMRDDQGSIRWA